LSLTSVSTTGFTYRTWDVVSVETLADRDVAVSISAQGADVQNATFLAAIPKRRVAYIKDIKPSGTNGGSTVANVSQTRDLNSLTGDTSFVSLDSVLSRFTLQKGLYKIKISTPCYASEQHQCFLHNTTDGIYIDGSSSYAAIAGPTQNSSFVETELNLLTAKTLEVVHWTAGAKPANGLGVSTHTHVSNPQSNEVYTQVTVEKLY